LPPLGISGHLLPFNSSDSDLVVDDLAVTHNRSPARPRTRILIADAHPIVRIGIHTLLSGEPDLQVVGEVAHGAEVESAVARLTPHLLILDVNLPELDAIATARRLAKRYPEVGILILTACDDEEIVFGLLEAGVTGYVLKEESPTNLLSAIRAVAQGQIWLSSRVAHVVVRRAVAAWGPLTLCQSLSALTEREQEVLALMGQGLSNRQIAEALCISVGTVRSHLNRIYDKTGLGGRSQAMRYAIAHGLVKGLPKG
jgi:RNA polymerase sigma factor (sigma-70 family)